jgi:hypothetical protein
VIRPVSAVPLFMALTVSVAGGVVKSAISREDAWRCRKAA